MRTDQIALRLEDNKKALPANLWAAETPHGGWTCPRRDAPARSELTRTGA